MIDVKEINFVNGTDCGSGYDVYGYVYRGEAAAMIRHVRTRRTVYAILDPETAEQSCFTFANGADIPPDSEDGAESLWDALHEVWNNRSTASEAGIQS